MSRMNHNNCMNHARPLCCLVLSMLPLALGGSLAMAGDLNPPAGAVAPTMKTLQQVEPRIPISAATTPGDNDATPSRFKITQAGSYYLTGFVQADAGQVCIEITGTDNVEIDMRGFSSSDGNTGATGFISVGSNVARVTLRNGQVSNYPYLILAGGDTQIIVEDIDMVGEAAFSTTPCIRAVSGEVVVRRSRFSSVGPINGPTTVVESCTFNFCGVGVESSRARVSDCTFRSCVVGVSVGSGSIVRNCNAYGSADTSFKVQAGNTDVEFSSCVSIDSQGFGFEVESRARLIDCASQGAPIIATDRCLFERCRVTSGAGEAGFSVGEECVFIDCAVTGATLGGFFGGSGSTLTGCTATGCSTAGFSFQNNTTFRDCVAISNNASGFVAVNGATFIDCRADSNTQRGYSVSDRATFTNCSATSNSTGGFNVRDGATFTNCFASDNTGDGFIARFGSRWDNCVSRSNTNEGIESGNGGLIRGCLLDTNGLGASTGANIRITGDACRVEGNTLIAADFGIQATTGGSIIIRNSSRNCPSDYAGIVAGNIVGTIVTTEALMNGATNDNVNIEH
jgi:hypothetical protein